MKKATEPTPIATFSIVVCFSDLPDEDALDRILDECKAYGRVKKAVYEIHRAVRKEFK
jgi:hypothetical protein